MLMLLLITVDDYGCALFLLARTHTLTHSHTHTLTHSHTHTLTHSHTAHTARTMYMKRLQSENLLHNSFPSCYYAVPVHATVSQSLDWWLRLLMSLVVQHLTCKKRSLALMSLLMLLNVFCPWHPIAVAAVYIAITFRVDVTVRVRDDAIPFFVSNAVHERLSW